MSNISDLLTIQKFIYLLDEFHFIEFTDNLKENKAELPLKLSLAIRKKLPGFDTHEALCKKVYGKYDKNERLAFNQLASYTFKLSAGLAVNYPAYLSPNYPIIQRQVNTGQTEQANFRAKALLEIAEKIEDYSTQIFILKFLIQQAFLMKETTLGVKLIGKLDTVYGHEKICHDIMSALRIHLNIALEPSVSQATISSYETFFTSHHKSASASVRLLSKYASVYLLYYHLQEKFKEPSSQDLVDDIEKELNNYSYIVFPFAFDIRSNFSFYKLNLSLPDLDTKTGKKEFEALKKHYGSVQFWKSYLNIPEIFAISLKASNYLTAYHQYVHRTDYYKLIPHDELKDIQSMADKCEELMSHTDLEQYYKNDLINLKLLHSGLLILSGGNGIKKGAEELETMLILYQQINLAGTTDSIFLFLIIAYFSMRNYEKCALTFKRYIRNSKGKTVYEDNDIEIHVYYYLSQWLHFKSRQYLAKLKTAYGDVKKNGLRAEQAKAIEEMVNYFEIPIELE